MATTSGKERIDKWRSEHPDIKRYDAEASAKRSERRRSLRLELITELGGKCIDCGISDTRVLEFDHVIGNKLRDVCHAALSSVEFARAEAAKCVLRCANCHRIKTLETPK